MDKEKKYCIEAVDGACKLLKELSNTGPLALKDLTVRLGFTKNKTFRLLETMITQGFIKRQGGLFALGQTAEMLHINAVNRLKAIRNTANSKLQELGEPQWTIK